MAQTLTLARPARNLRPYLWLALPLLVLATLFFYPLLLIAEQALRDASGNLSLETFWQVIDSKRFIGALLNTLQIAVFATLGCTVLGSVLTLILVFIPFPEANWWAGSLILLLRCRPFLSLSHSPLFTARRGCSTAP